MRKLIIAGALLCGIAVKSYAQQAPPDTLHIHNYSLAECISYAYQHQDSVVNAGLDVKSAGYKVKETIGQGLPQISGTAQFQDYLRLPVTLVDVSSFESTVPKGTLAPFKLGLNYQTTAALNLTQKIFDGNYLVGVKASKTYKELYERSLTRSRIETNVSVTKAYYQVLVSNEQIKLLDANIKQLKQQLDQTTAENKQGLAEQIDVQRLTVQYNNLVTSRDNTVRLLELNNELLKFQMGMAITDELTLTDKLEDINFNDAIANSSDTSFYHNRIEYSLLETQKRLNEYDLKSKKAQYLPSLSAFANYGTSFQNNSFGNLYSANYPSSYIGLTLNVPIFSGFQHLNQVRESKIAIIKTENDLFNLRNGIGLQANKARITYINGLQSLKSQKENMGLAEEVLRVAKIKYSQGVGSSIEVTQAQTDLDSADNSYIQSLYDALVSKVDLDQAYGRIQ